ncbi:hypothetical protein [Acinetobacter bereziniae]|uniref:hypothetical protein n=1 Tax=Acinetobacter bereziniae TaxID=106648 RepID=UPI00301A626C
MTSEKSKEIEDKEAELHTEKLKFMYEFQCEQYDIARAQTSKLDDKAAKYLTFVTIVMATLGIISRYYFFEISKYNFYSVVSAVLLCFAFALILNTSRLLFSSLQLKEVYKLSTGADMNQYIIASNLDDVYKDISDDLSQINESYRTSAESKKDFLTEAYKEISFLGIVLVLLLLSIIVDLCNRDVKPSKSTITTCIVDLSKLYDKHTKTCSTTTH